MKKIIASITIFLISTCALSQSIIPLRNRDGLNISIVNGKANSRLGKGVLAWLITSIDSDTNSWASLYYYSCDGRFLSDSGIRTFNSFLDDAKSRNDQLVNAIKISEIGDLGANAYSVAIIDYESSGFFLKENLKKSISLVCANASPEKKNKLFPFASSRIKPNGESTVYHILSGSLSRKGNIVSGWAEGHNTYAKESDKRPDGSTELLSALKNDGRTLFRYSVNCKESTFATMAIAKYDQFGSLTSSHDFKDYDYSPPVPRSISDAVVNFYCTVY